MRVEVVLVWILRREKKILYTQINVWEMLIIYWKNIYYWNNNLMIYLYYYLSISKILFILFILIILCYYCNYNNYSFIIVILNNVIIIIKNYYNLKKKLELPYNTTLQHTLKGIRNQTPIFIIMIIMVIILLSL